MYEKLFNKLLNCLTEPTEVVRNDLFKLYSNVNEVTRNNAEATESPALLLLETLEYLVNNLEKHPFSTASLIQQLLCCWNFKFKESDTILENLVANVIQRWVDDILENGLNDKITKLCAVLTQFQLSTNPKIIEKMATIAQNNYKCYWPLMLPLQSEPLQQILKFSLENEHQLDWCNSTIQFMHNRVHWLQSPPNELLSTPEMQLLNLILESNCNIINIKKLQHQYETISKLHFSENFIQNYLTEISTLLNIIKFCQNRNNNKVIDLNTIIDVAKTSSALSTITRFCDISQSQTWPEISELIEWRDLFDTYCIIVSMINCITFTGNTPEEYYSQVTVVLDQVKNRITSLVPDLQLEVIENIFTLLFLRYENYSNDDEIDGTTKNSGFVCNELVFRDTLHMLITCVSSDLSNKNIRHNINEALTRLQFVSTPTFFENVNMFGPTVPTSYCRCDEQSYCFYSIEFDSSESEESSIQTSGDDSDVKRKRRHRSETEKSSGSETTASSGKSKRKLPRRSVNNDAIRERRYLFNFMLSSPQSLICLCLAQLDYERVSKIIQMYHLENSHIAANVTFTKNLQDLRTKLNKLFFKQDTSVSKKSTDVAILNLQKLTSSVYDATQIINLVEKFFSLNMLPENTESKTIIEKFAPVYPFLLNFGFKNEVFMHVFDIAITLGLRYEHSATLMKCAKRYGESCDNGSDYGIFYEAVQRSYEDCNTSIPIMLLDYRYELKVKNLKKVTIVMKKLGFLQQQFTKSSANSFKEIIKNFSELFRLLEIHPQITYLQRIQIFIQLFSPILQYLKLPFKNHYQLLNYNPTQLVDLITFESNHSPAELEDIFQSTNLDLILYLTKNATPKIPVKMNITEYPNFNSLDEINLYLGEEIRIGKLDKLNIKSPKEKTLKYISKHNQLIGELISTLWTSETPQIEVLNNALQSPKVSILSKAFASNGITTILYDFIPFEISSRYIILSSSYDTLAMILSMSERQLKTDKLMQRLQDLTSYDLVGKVEYKYCDLIRDQNLLLKVVLENFIFWSADVNLRLMKQLLTSFEDVVGVEVLNEWIEKIEIYQEISIALDAKSWNQVFERCKSNSGDVLEELLKKEQIETSIKWFKLHRLTEQSHHLITIDYIKTIFTNNIDLEIIKNILLQLPPDRTDSICLILLKTLKNFAHLNFLINLTPKYKKVKTGIQLLQIINPSPENPLWALIDEPLLIMEQYLMNTKLEKLQILISSIDELEGVDELLRYYAAKALDFRVEINDKDLSTEASTQGSTRELLQSIDSLSLTEKVFIMPEEVPQKSDWMKDYETTVCVCCTQTVFSMFNRRHHCRRCGRVVCGACSEKRLKIKNYNDVPVRVCLQCYELSLAKQNTETNSQSSTTDYSIENWQLNPTQLATIRNEFSYEYAPSVSLCLSILKLHSSNQQYTEFLLNQCHSMLDLVFPSQTGQLNKEIDYNLMIQMLRSLIIAAKVNCAKNDEPKIENCDILLGHTDVLHMLSINDCLHLFPAGDTKGDRLGFRLQKLRDNLMENEKWNLALEISTKVGLDNTGVFAVWGKTCLKAGCFKQAREKFSYCLDKVSDEELSNDSILTSTSLNRPAKNPSLVTEIVQTLEKLTYKTDFNENKYVKYLANLNEISSGNFNRPSEGSNSLKLEKCVYDECIYYLHNYGSHISLIEFLLRHEQIKDAVCYICDNELDPEYYVELYVWCLKNGIVDKLQTLLTELDSTLVTYKQGIKYICRYLEQNNCLHILYQLQNWMEDHIRAAMTCIKFYQCNASSYLDLLRNLEYLHSAQNHLKHELESDWVEIEPAVISTSIDTSMILKMESREVDKHINTIWRQIEVTKYIASNEKVGRKTIQLLPQMFKFENEIGVPTLFGKKLERIQLAVLCIVSGENVTEGFGLAFRIIQDYQLNASKIFCIASKQLAHLNDMKNIEKLVDCISTSGMSEENCSVVSDEVLAVGVKEIIETNQNPQVENLIKLIKDVNIKISAYIESKQLKSAYLLAVRHDRIRDVRRILREAERLNQPHIRNICAKRLAQHDNK